MILDSEALRATGIILAAMDAQIAKGVTFEGVVTSHLLGEASAKGAVVKWSSATGSHVVEIP